MKAIIIDSSALPGVPYTREKKLFDENGIEFVVYDCHCEAEVIEACRTADAVLDIYTKLTPKIIDTKYEGRCDSRQHLQRPLNL